MLCFPMTDLEEKQADQIIALTTIIQDQSKQISDQSKQIRTQNESLKKLMAQVEQLTALANMNKSEKSSRRKSGDASTRRSDVSSNPKKEKKKTPSSNNMSFPEGIPEEVIRIDLPNCDKYDPITGKAFALIDENRYEYLVFEKVYKKLVVIQPVYGMGSELGVAKMDLPERLLNTKADASLLAHIMVRRVLEHTPFYRQVESFVRDGFSISRQALNSWFYSLAKALMPLHSLQKEWILEQNALHVDETFVKRQIKGKDKLKDTYMWFIAARANEIESSTLPTQAGDDCVVPDQQVVWMQFFENRNHENALKILEGYGGKVHSDCYQAYEKMADDGQFTWQACLVHARRKFVKANADPIAMDFDLRLAKIIYEDNQLWNLDERERLRRRRTEIRPLMDGVLTDLKKLRNDLKVDASDKLSKAFDYILKREKHFTAFLDDADLLIDNNRAERAIRPVKIGQRNWLFIGSEKGGEASAIMYSFLLTCKNLGVNPQEWLTGVIRNLPYTPESELKSLLPQNWKPQINKLSPFLPTDYKFF